MHNRNFSLAVLLSLGVVSSSSLLSSCSSKTVLRVFNWGEYIQTDLLKEFEKEFNCDVKYSTFDSNESAIIQMTNNSFDVVIPSDYAIEELASKNMLQELDWNKIYASYASAEGITETVSDGREGMKAYYTDYINTITDRLLNDDNSFDFFKYAAPYFSGNVGIVYNADKISPSVIEEKGWDIVRDNSYNLAYYDSSRDGFMVPLKALGYSMNTTSTSEIDDAYNWLKVQKDNFRKNTSKTVSYITDEVLDGMVQGIYDIGLVYSGDACYVMNESKLNLDFYVPSSGTNVWVDGMVIPTNAKQVDLAHEFIAFMTRTNSGYENAMEVCYNPSTKKAFEKFVNENADFSDYYSYEIAEKDEIYRYNSEIKTYMDKKWLDFLNY